MGAFRELDSPLWRSLYQRIGTGGFPQGENVAEQTPISKVTVEKSGPLIVLEPFGNTLVEISAWCPFLALLILISVGYH